MRLIKGHTRFPSLNRILINQGLQETFPKEHFAFRLESEGFMPLSIESIGTGPHGHPAISVMHWFTQHGDLMRDPDIEFEVAWNPYRTGHWEFYPYTYRQDPLGLWRELAWNIDGKLYKRHDLIAETCTFCTSTWSPNLKAQGFVQASAALPEFLTN